MNLEDKDNILLGLYYQNIAKRFFEASLLDKKFDPRIVNGYINRLNYIEGDILARLKSEEDREWFREEITQGDTMLLANIGMVVRNMKPEKRIFFEKLCQAIARGEAIEVEHKE